MQTLEILFEDNHCLAVSKPAGLLVQPDRTGDPSLLDHARDDLRARYSKPGDVFVGVVHRLDRPVSGVVLLARTSKAAGRLAKQFRDGTVEKTYLALVESPPESPNAVLEHFLVKDSATNRVRVAQPDEAKARRARLRYTVQGPRFRGTLVEVRPDTGRSHQIRVQLAACGSVILGDVRYGSKNPLGGMIALHASELSFQHPIRQERVTIRAPLPASWSALLLDP